MGNAPPAIATIDNNNDDEDNASDIFNNNHSRLSMLDVFCGNRAAKEIVRNIEVNEIVLSKTYSDPKGTYNNESVKFFNPKEKLLFYFASKDNVAAVRYFTINGVNINILDEDRTSPLHIACKSGSLQMVEEMINQGAMINLPDLIGWTPLHIAAYNSRPDVILLLLKNGANYQTRNREKQAAKELCGKNRECLEIFENFLLHKEIEMIRTIQQKEMQINYYTQCLENIENNNTGGNKTMMKEHYFNTIDYGNHHLQQQQLQNSNSTSMEYIPKYINVNKSIGLYRNASSNYKQQQHLYKKEMHKSNNIASMYQQNTFDHEAYNSDPPQYNNANDDVDNDNDEEDGIEDTDEVPNEFINYEEEVINHKRNKEKREYTKQFLSKYKYIPKKHKFYLQYQMCNGKVLSKTINNTIDYHIPKENSIPSLIRLPNQFPVFTSIQQLNNDNHKIEENALSEEHEKYRPYDNDDYYNNDGNDDDYSSCSNSSTNNLYPSLMINHSKVDQMSNAETIKLSPNNTSRNNDHNSLLIEENNDTVRYSLDYDRMIFNDQDTQRFFQESHHTFTNVFFHRFMLCKEEIEEMLLLLFSHDYKFTLMVLMSLYPSKNTYGSLLQIIKKNILLKELRSVILLGEARSSSSTSSLLSIYFSSFNCTSLNEALNKSMSNIMIQSDICIIDNISKEFAKNFYHSIHSNTEDGYLIQSENSLYFLVFAILITDMSFRGTNTPEQREKFLCDLMIILKDMNEGESFNQEYLAKFVNYIKGNGYFGAPHISSPMNKVKSSSVTMESERFSFGFIINNKYKLFYAKSIGNGTFALFTNKKTEEISSVIFLNRTLLDVQLHGNMLLFMDKVGSIEMNNVIMLKNRRKMIKVKQYDQIKVLIDNKDKIKEIVEYYVSKRK